MRIENGTMECTKPFVCLLLLMHQRNVDKFPFFDVLYKINNFVME